MLRIAAVAHLRFDSDQGRPPFDGLREVFAERLAPYAVPVADELSGNRNSFSRMCAAVLARLCPQDVPDVVLVAHAAHDCDLSTSIAGYLQQRLPGDPLVFAVSDQGATTGFAALTLAQALYDTGGGTRIAVVLLDQATFPYTDPLLAGLDRRQDHAVGLLLAPDGDVAVTGLRVCPRTGPRSPALAEAVKEATAAPAGVVVAGAGLDPADVAAAAAGPVVVRHAARDRLTTAVWSALAQELSVPDAGPRTVVAVEHETALGYLCTLTLTVSPRNREDRP
ncbi:hypothetical protein Cs7R123_62070 [Catellatospora sp. TT07R-123]|uniref:hypothetical protein n=1 Tax=Catellatospora sp. TT07R-123 TaxID=2733863 RepID=UPI001B16D840|nr:hypothetical protein [Catellatospora sp. TT07R-123]GHJ48865.1 hypothetical protein Cs7R123_62070 [Catellatospora sp. TT07R-123]